MARVSGIGWNERVSGIGHRVSKCETRNPKPGTRYPIPELSMTEIPPHVRGLVFDCDGTIADTMPLHYQAWTLALKEHGKDFSEAMFYEMAGIPTRRIFEILNEKHHYNLPIDECTERKAQSLTKL